MKERKNPKANVIVVRLHRSNGIATIRTRAENSQPAPHVTKQLRQQQQLQLQQQVDAATENGVESDYIVTEPGDFTFDIFPVQPPAIAQAMWLFRFILGKDTREKVFEPAMADILLDYAEAVPFQKGWAAGWLQFCWWMRFLRLATSIVGADLGESISRMATWVCSGFRQKS